jgi:hypothetical protein
LILDLASLVDKCLRTSIVHTIHTLALGSTDGTCLKALQKER